MNITEDDVLNKNTLKIKYDGEIPFLEIHIHNHLFDTLQSDYQLKIIASLLEDSSLKLTIQLKSFSSAINFNTVIPGWDKHKRSIYDFITSFVSLNKINIRLVSFDKTSTYQKTISLPFSVREVCKTFIGELLTFEKNDGLEETFLELPIGFIVPFSNDSFFLLLCKIEDTVFEKIKFLPKEEIEFKISANTPFIELTMNYQRMNLGLLRISKKDICDDIVEDFHRLLSFKKLSFAITNQSMANKQYLSFVKPLTDAQSNLIADFFSLSPSKEKQSL